MGKVASFVSLSGIVLYRDENMPLYQQLYDEIRTMILNGVLPSGSRLPPTRTLCEELNLSRSTVVEAMAQLGAEGYLESQVGRGTFVAEVLPEKMLQVSGNVGRVYISNGNDVNGGLSERGKRITAVSIPHKTDGLFRPGMPDTETFPFKTWRKMIDKHWQTANTTSLGYGDPAGYLPLREAIADHVRLSRRVNCTSEQVIITAGAQQALYLTAQLLVGVGDPVWVENPGYSGAHVAFRAAGAALCPIPVDEHGLNVTAGIEIAPDAKLIYVCPSHQYPVGGTLPVARRLQLLDWAAQNGAWIVEDDYDSEYRYSGHPLASLQGLDEQQRVIYMGTFSKVMFPSLRLGYVIVPPSLRDAFVKARSVIDRGSSAVNQMALHDFMRDGHFSRHIRRLRVIYAQRQQAAIDAIERFCGGVLEIRPFPAGIHLLAWLPAGWDDQSVSKILTENSFAVQPLSNYSLIPLRRGGLVFGYAAHNETVIWSEVKRMAEVLRAI